MEIIESKPELFTLKDPFDVERWMCKNCGLIFDYQFEIGELGWPAFDPSIDAIHVWIDDVGNYQFEEPEYSEHCPRCKINFDSATLVRIRVRRVKNPSSLTNPNVKPIGKTRQKFARLAQKYAQKDSVTKSILNSYAESRNDLDNELIRLFEIWETLSRNFGGEQETLNTLRISNSQKRTLSRLANSEPLRQSRHRGRFSGQLRDATIEELKTARLIAVKMIHAYLDYLERKEQGSSPN